MYILKIFTVTNIHALNTLGRYFNYKNIVTLPKQV